MDRFKNMHVHFIKIVIKSTILKAGQCLARKKLQIEIKDLVIIWTSFLVDPPILRDARCLIWVLILEGEDVSPNQLLNFSL
jgi:hypothetical protein